MSLFGSSQASKLALSVMLASLLFQSHKTEAGLLIINAFLNGCVLPLGVYVLVFVLNLTGVEYDELGELVVGEPVVVPVPP